MACNSFGPAPSCGLDVLLERRFEDHLGVVVFVILLEVVGDGYLR